MPKRFRVLWLAIFLLIPAAPLFAEAGWNNGFYIKSEDGQFQINLGGRLQAMHSAQKRVGGVSTSPNRDPSDNFDNTFRLRRARLQTTGKIFEKANWYTILHHGSAAAGGNARTDIFAGAGYDFVPQFRLGFGMVQQPLDRIGEDSSAWYLLVDAPLTANQEDGLEAVTIQRQALGLPFSLGVRADGDIGKHFSYAIATSNGNSFREMNANNELAYSGMLIFHLIGQAWGKQTDYAFSETPNLTISFGSGFEGDDAADPLVPAVNRLWAWTSSAGGRFLWRGFSLTSEIYYRVLQLSRATLEDTNADSKLKDTGYYGLVGYYLIPKKLEVSLMGAQIFREGPDNNANEFGGGLNWYIHENRVKLQLDYTNVLDFDEVAGLDNATFHRFRTMFSLFL